MTIENLIAELKKFPPQTEIVVSSDEELNSLFGKIQVAELEGENKAVIYGLSNSLID